MHNIKSTLLFDYFGLAELTATPPLCLTNTVCTNSIFVDSAKCAGDFIGEINNTTQFISPFMHCNGRTCLCGLTEFELIYCISASFQFMLLSDAPPPASVFETATDLDCFSG